MKLITDDRHCMRLVCIIIIARPHAFIDER